MSDLLIASSTWADVAIAFIAGLPSIIAAVAAILIRRDIATPSGRGIGSVAEENLDTANTTQRGVKAIANGQTPPFPG